MRRVCRANWRLANNRVRRLRARSLAEGREDVPFNSPRVGIVNENRFWAAANVNTRSPEFFGSRDSLSFALVLLLLLVLFLHATCSRPFDRPALNTNDRHFLPLVVVFRRRWLVNFNSPSRFNARILPSLLAVTRHSRFVRYSPRGLLRIFLASISIENQRCVVAIF